MTGRHWNEQCPRLGAVLLILIALASGALSADQRADQSAVKSGRDALDGYTTFPWYDRDRDDVRRVDVEPPADIAARKSKWEAKPVNWNWPEWLSILLRAAGYLLLGIALLAVVYFLVKAFGLAEWGPSAGAAADLEDPLHGDIDRVEALPFQLQRPQSDLLSEARRHYEAGDYGQAIIYLYSYQLVQLDRHSLIRLAKGKTNRQYLREVRSRGQIWDVLRGSMIAFEDVFFGHHVLNRSRFENCWERLDEFHQQLELVAA